MADRTTTRRAVLGAIASLPAIAVAAPALAQITPTERAAWDRAFAAFQRTKAASDASDVEVNRAYEAFKTMEPSAEMIEFREFTLLRGNPTPFERNHIARVMNVEEDWQHFLDAEGKTWWARDPEARKRKYRAALDTIVDYRRKLAEAEEVSGYNAACERSDQLGEAACDAESALILTPAPDREALLYKLDRLFGSEARGDDHTAPAWCAEWMNAVMADAHRLLSGEA